MLSVEAIRKICLSFPKSTEQIQWGDHLLFKIGGKMFAIASLEPSAAVLSFKVTAANFAELTERPNIIPAPYLARASWIALESREALDLTEAENLLRHSYELIVAKLPRRVRESVTHKKELSDGSIRKKTGSSKHRKTRDKSKRGSPQRRKK
jgi:predicted DNA-binding protein (MmcQ/YjbR family)